MYPVLAIKLKVICKIVLDFTYLNVVNSYGFGKERKYLLFCLIPQAIYVFKCPDLRVMRMCKLMRFCRDLFYLLKIMQPVENNWSVYKGFRLIRVIDNVL